MGDTTHRIVILGGGFGGLEAAKALKRAPAHVKLIDRRNFHLFQPLLYQVATGGLSPGDIAEPLRIVMRAHKNTEVLMGEVTAIDPARRKVILEAGDVDYDTLILAAGSENTYFGHDHWAELAPGLKSIEDATAVRRRILVAFEAAEREPDPRIRRQWLTFVIVGGGPTGVELAGALGEIANDSLKGDFRTIDPCEAQILVIEGAPRVLPPFPPDLSAKAEHALVKLNVRTITGAKVTQIDANGVTLQTGNREDRIQTRTVIWAAGVKASPLAAALAKATGAELDKGGRIKVAPDLTIPGHPEIFVIGDLAHFEQDGKELAGVAPVAMSMGRYAARAILRRLRCEPPKPFHYLNKGNLATIGRGAAVAEIGRLHLSGWFAWFIWLFVHLMYLVGFQNRLLVFFQWGFQYLSFNRGARLITGESPLPFGQRKEHGRTARS